MAAGRLPPALAIILRTTGAWLLSPQPGSLANRHAPRGQWRPHALCRPPDVDRAPLRTPTSRPQFAQIGSLDMGRVRKVELWFERVQFNCSLGGSGRCSLCAPSTARSLVTGSICRRSCTRGRQRRIRKCCVACVRLTLPQVASTVLTSRSAIALGETQAIHSVTCGSMDGGSVRPRTSSVFAFTAKSRIVGCSTGSSAGRAPLRILSTTRPALRGSVSRSGP